MLFAMVSNASKLETHSTWRSKKKGIHKAKWREKGKGPFERKIIVGLYLFVRQSCSSKRCLVCDAKSIL